MNALERQAERLVAQAVRLGSDQIVLWRVAKGRGLWQPSQDARWSPPGVDLIYAASTPALALLEAMVHLSPAAMRHPHRLCRLPLQFAPDDGDRLDRQALPRGWCRQRRLTQAIGRAWRRRERLLLCVPSAVIPEECNVLVNPCHPQWRACLSAARHALFRFDSRLRR